MAFRTPADLARPRTVALVLVTPVLLGLVLVSPTSSYLVRTVTALAAMAVLLVGATRHRDGLGPARVAFAVSLLVGALSGVVSAVHVAVHGQPASVGGLSDWVYLASTPIAVLGVLSLPRASAEQGGRLRAVADGAVAAGALWYLALVLVVDRYDLGGNLEGAARVATVAYPLLPAFVLAVILSAVPRVEPGVRPFLLRAALGMGLLGLSDVAFAVVSWTGEYRPDSWVAAANQLGLVLILSAALVGARPVAAYDAAGHEAADLAATRGVLVMAAPFVPLLLSVPTAGVELLQGEGVPNSQLAPIVLLGAAVAVRHLASARETGQMVERLVARERSAREQARTDALTGLLNRPAFLDRLDRVLQDPSTHPVAVALLDLNDFKDINDSHGHDTGDEVLRQTADRLRVALVGGGIARLGGDEFAAFLPATHGTGHELGERLARAFAEPVQVGRRHFAVRPSVGVVIDERPAGAAKAGDGAHLLAHADVAMYEAKSAKGQRHVPVTVLLGRARASAAATITLREEVSRPDLSQFHVAYQPIVDLRTGGLVGAEALLRWTHPLVGDVPPSTFIPLAERVGTMAVLGEHVLTVALDDLASWSRAHGHGPVVGVNMSPRQLTDPMLAATVSRMLAERGLRPEQLSVEVTEEAFVDDMESVVTTVAAFRTAGVSVSVDDFGTGYSSLRYLRRFDASVLKIDKEFVQAAPAEPRTEALVRSVVVMADALGLTCVAEGVETLEQLALVRALGCQLGQGFLLDRPMPAAALARLLEGGHVYPVDVGAPTPTATLRAMRSQRVEAG